MDKVFECEKSLDDYIVSINALKPSYYSKEGVYHPGFIIMKNDSDKKNYLIKINHDDNKVFWAQECDWWLLMDHDFDIAELILKEIYNTEPQSNIITQLNNIFILFKNEFSRELSNYADEFLDLNQRLFDEHQKFYKINQ